MLGLRGCLRGGEHPVKTIAVCPHCYRIPNVDECGFNVCPEHGTCKTLRLVEVRDPNNPDDEDGDETEDPKSLNARVLGKCRAKITSSGSPVRGKRCGRPARYIDPRNRPVCGYHMPTSARKVHGRASGSIAKRKVARKAKKRQKKTAKKKHK